MTNFSWCVYCFYYLSRLASTCVPKSSQFGSARPLCQMFVSHLSLWCQMLCSRPSRRAFSSSSPKVELTPIIIFTGDAIGHIIWCSLHFWVHLLTGISCSDVFVFESVECNTMHYYKLDHRLTSLFVTPFDCTSVICVIPYMSCVS